jgi:hypothetical protein
LQRGTQWIEYLFVQIPLSMSKSSRNHRSIEQSKFLWCAVTKQPSNTNN